MGIQISLQVDFSNVTQAQWEAVYSETLNLVELYPFMDLIIDQTSYVEKFIYLERTIVEISATVSNGYKRPHPQSGTF